MKLIDKDSVKKGIEELKQSPWYNEHNLDHFPIRKEAVEVVEHLCIDKEPTIVEFDGEVNEVIVRGEKYYKPTIDVVPVVRCKDCKYFGGACWCRWYECGTSGNGYCHRGEREDKDDV